MGSVAWYAALEARRRWRSVLGLAMLVAVAGTVVIGAAAGARRTSSAFDRLASSTSARDATVQIDDIDPITEASITDRIEALDIVDSATRAQVVLVAPASGEDSEEMDVTIGLSPDGWGTTIDRPVVTAGRLPRPGAANEVLANEVARDQFGLGIGSRFGGTTFTTEDLDAMLSGEFQGFNGPPLELHVVGIGRFASDLQGDAGTFLLGTPALVDDVTGRVGLFTGLLAVRLDPGASFDDLRKAVAPIVGDGEYEVTSSDEEFADAARDSADVLGQSLLVFAAVAALASAVVVGGAISRQFQGSTDHGIALSAMGWTGAQQDLARSAVPAIGIAVGAGGAGVGAVAVSGLFPFGIARRMEPTPGPRIDSFVVFLGVTAVFVAGLGLLLVLAHAGSRSRGPAAVRPDPRASRLAPAFAALPVAVAVGIRHAVQRRTANGPVPVLAGLAAATVAVMGVVGAATTVRSLDGLLDAPVRYGWAWSSQPESSTNESLGTVAAAVAEADGVAAVGVRSEARVELDGLVLVGGAIETESGSLTPTMLAGRPPAGDDEVAVGASTADALGVEIGEEVTARGASGRPDRAMTVVGVSVLAPMDDGDPSAGALLTADGLEAVRRSDGFSRLVLRYEDGADVEAVEMALSDSQPVAFSFYSGPRIPSLLVNLDRSVPVIAGLGVFSGLLGVAGVGHAQIVGARRRRHELATLRALGLRRGQIRSVVRWNTVATVVIGIVLGAPIGLAIGRTAWQLMVGGLGVIDDPGIPWRTLVMLAPVAVVLALVLAWWPGRQAVRNLHPGVGVD